jgi:hypothetical protein
VKSGSSILARLIADALVVGILALISFAQLAIIISPAWAQERLKVIVSGPRLKDWRFTLCGERRCITGVVLCAPGYHIVYGNRCVANVHTPPSWEDQVQPVVPPCIGCSDTRPTLYELYARSWVSPH